MYIRHGRAFVTNTRSIFRKGLILLDFRRWIRNYRIKYVIFKSPSSKYNEVFHCYLYIIKELPVYRSISLSHQPKDITAVGKELASRALAQRCVQRQGQIRGRKVLGFGWTTLGWAMMTSIVQQGSSLGSSLTSPSLNPNYNRTSGHWPYQALSGGKQRQIQLVGKEGICASSGHSPTTKALSAAAARDVQLQAYPTADVLTPTSRWLRNQPQPQTQQSQPTTAAFLIQTALLRDNLRKFSETTFGFLTTLSCL